MPIMIAITVQLVNIVYVKVNITAMSIMMLMILRTIRIIATTITIIINNSNNDIHNYKF